MACCLRLPFSFVLWVPSHAVPGQTRTLGCSGLVVSKLASSTTHPTLSGGGTGITPWVINVIIIIRYGEFVNGIEEEEGREEEERRGE